MGICARDLSKGPTRLLCSHRRPQQVLSDPVTSLDLHSAVVDRGEHLGWVPSDHDVDDSRAVAFFHAPSECRRQGLGSPMSCPFLGPLFRSGLMEH
jgi:hypothetical protein